MMENHRRRLRSFTIGNAALTSGSWRSFFTRVRKLQPHLEVIGKGELLGRTHMDVLDFTEDINVCKLTEFMKDMDTEWPFVGKQIIDFRLAGEPM